MQKANLLEALAFGNHKGAMEQPSLLQQLVEEDVVLGFRIPFLLHSIHLIPGAVIAPMNIIRQNTIYETGHIVKKDQFKNNQSY